MTLYRYIWIRIHYEFIYSPAGICCGYSKAPEQPQSSARPISFSLYDEHRARTATIRFAAQELAVLHTAPWEMTYMIMMMMTMTYMA